MIEDKDSVKSDTMFRDSGGDMWLNISSLKKEGNIMLETITNENITLDPSELYVGTGSAELLISLSEEDESNLEAHKWYSRGVSLGHELEIWGEYEAFDSGHKFFVTLCDIVDHFCDDEEEKCDYINTVWQYYELKSDNSGVEGIDDSQYGLEIDDWEQFISAIDGAVISQSEGEYEHYARAAGAWAHGWQENYGVTGQLWL